MSERSVNILWKTYIKLSRRHVLTGDMYFQGKPSHLERRHCHPMSELSSNDAEVSFLPSLFAVNFSVGEYFSSRWWGNDFCLPFSGNFPYRLFVFFFVGAGCFVFPDRCLKYLDLLFTSFTPLLFGDLPTL